MDVCVCICLHTGVDLCTLQLLTSCLLLTLDAEVNADIYWFVQIDPVNISHQTSDVKRKIFSACEFLHIRQTRRGKKSARTSFFTDSQLKFHENV